MRIFGFWHICAVGCWEKIWPDQWKQLHDSGLYAASERIYIVVNGVDDPDRAPGELPEYIRFDPKVVYTEVGTRMTFEYATLDVLRNVALAEEEPFYAWYIHSKGAMTANHEIRNAAYWWGKYMEHYTINHWRRNVAKLDEGYEACGVEERYAPRFHMSGNFWWVRSEYARRLGDIEAWKALSYKYDRIMSEMYMGSANPRRWCWKNTGQNLYLYSVTPDQWEPV